MIHRIFLNYMVSVYVSMLLLALPTSSAYCQNDTSLSDMNRLKKQSLCVIKTVDKQVIYLTDLARIEHRKDTVSYPYNNSDALFLRYEIWKMQENSESLGIRERALMYCKPERIMTRDLISYDTYIFYRLVDNKSSVYENSESTTLEHPLEKWEAVGDYINDGMYKKILHYFFKNRENIPVYQEDILPFE